MSTVWGAILAWASIAVAACCRMFCFVNSIISFAMSVSRIRASAEVRFSVVVARLLTVYSRRFWMAPRSERVLETEDLL